MTTPDERELQHRATEALRGQRTAEGPERTVLLKEAAQALVEVRRLFKLNSGAVDVSGRSADYMRFANTALDEAGVPESERASLRSSLRYHISTAVRDVFGAADLQPLNLVESSVRERASDRHANQRKLVRLFTGSEPIHDVTDLLQFAINGAQAAARVVPLDKSTPDVDAEAVRAAFTRFSSEVSAAVERLDAR